MCFQRRADKIRDCADKLGADTLIPPLQVAAARHRDGGLDIAWRVRIATVTFEVLHTASGRKHRHQMRTSRSADSADSVGIDTILDRVRTHTPDGRFSVMK